MSSFDKFMEDLERRNREKRARLEQLQKAEEDHNLRTRVARYAERWQNSIRYRQRGEK